MCHKLLATTPTLTLFWSLSKDWTLCWSSATVANRLWICSVDCERYSPSVLFASLNAFLRSAISYRKQKDINRKQLVHKSEKRNRSVRTNHNLGCQPLGFSPQQSYFWCESVYNKALWIIWNQQPKRINNKRSVSWEAIKAKRKNPFPILRRIEESSKSSLSLFQSYKMSNKHVFIASFKKKKKLNKVKKGSALAFDLVSAQKRKHLNSQNRLAASSSIMNEAVTHAPKKQQDLFTRRPDPWKPAETEEPSERWSWFRFTPRLNTRSLMSVVAMTTAQIRNYLKRPLAWIYHDLFWIVFFLLVFNSNLHGPHVVLHAC